MRTEKFKMYVGVLARELSGSTKFSKTDEWYGNVGDGARCEESFVRGIAGAES
jgi:hypothetical protein